MYDASKNSDQNSLNFEDDDFILPIKSPNYMLNKKINYYDHPSVHCYEDDDINLETVNNTIYNQFNLNPNSISYKKCPMQPEDNIWIKKFNTNTFQPNSNYASPLNDQEILL